MNATTVARQSAHPESDDSHSAGQKAGMDWKFELLGKLAAPGARRVYTAGEFLEFVRSARPGAAASTARQLADSFVLAGFLRQVSSGIYLNRRAFPPAELTEIAAHLRSGAVVSLHSVLGEAGFLNNIAAPNLVVAVVPTSTTRRPRLGEIRTSTGDTFRFLGLAERFFPQTAEDRWKMLQPGRPCEMFRPEAALLQWLHLGRMARSPLTAPPEDVDMDVLNLELLDELAQRWGLEVPLRDWKRRAESVGYGKDQGAAPVAKPEPFHALYSRVPDEDLADIIVADTPPAPAAEPTDAERQARRQQAQEARARLMARRGTGSAKP